jgi:hypothetical protein
MISDVSYIGALPDSRPCACGVLEASNNRLAVLGGRIMDDFLGTSVPGQFVLPTDRIVAAAVEVPEQVEKRVTATRLFLVRIFAFACLRPSRGSSA